MGQPSHPPESVLTAESDGQLGQAIEQDLPAKFDDFPISAALKSAVAEMGYTEPTAVQAQVVGPAIAGSAAQLAFACVKSN